MKVVFDTPIHASGRHIFDDPLLFVYVFKKVDESGGGTDSSRAHISKTKLSAMQLAQIQQEDEELMAIVTIIGKMIL